MQKGFEQRAILAPDRVRAMRGRERGGRAGDINSSDGARKAVHRENKNFVTAI